MMMAVLAMKTTATTAFPKSVLRANLRNYGVKRVLKIGSAPFSSISRIDLDKSIFELIDAIHELKEEASVINDKLNSKCCELRSALNLTQ
jgi:hypothetical protein